VYRSSSHSKVPQLSITNRMGEKWSANHNISLVLGLMELDFGVRVSYNFDAEYCRCRLLLI
jgi:hypothetical protein